MNRRVFILVAVLMVMPAPARSEPVSVKKTADTRPTPAAGFTLERRRVGIRLEVGFPFVLLQLSYGVGAGLELITGYRGFYALTPGAFAGVKGQLVTNKAGTVGLSLMALGGWTHLKKYWDIVTEFTGGTGGFGELWLMFTGRRGRHGMFVNGGVRVSEVKACKHDECDSHILNGKKGVGVVIFAEIGYEVRINRYASYFVAGGANMFPNGKQFPGFVTGRTGIIMEF